MCNEAGESMGVFRYPVKKQWINGLPEIPYRFGIGAYEGVVMHFTGNYNDTAASEAAYEARTFQNAFVHEFIDPVEIIQVANPDYIAYGAGSAANRRFVHLELCHADTKADFNRSYDMWCERAAEYLAARELGVTPAQPDGTGTLWSHADVTKYLGGTTHTDPLAYLAEWGKSWDNVLETVTIYYNELIELKGGVGMEKKTDFPDVEAGRWSEDSIAEVSRRGLMTGYEDGTFRPAQPVTREELAKVVNDLIYWIEHRE